MARAAALSAEGRRLVWIAIVASAVGAAHAASSDAAAFVGNWTFESGSQVVVQLDCPALQSNGSAVGTVPVARPLTGTPLSLYPDPSHATDLVFDIGCHCQIGLDVSGSHAAMPAGPQPCEVVSNGMDIGGDISSLSLDVDPSTGVLSISELGGEATKLVFGGTSCPSSPFSLSGTLLPGRNGGIPSGAVPCGDPAYAVGVLPVDRRGVTDCPLGAGREGLQIDMHDEDDSHCSDETGGRGEGSWLLPDDVRPRPQPPVCSDGNMTTLRFCRVDGARFAPTTSAADPNGYYAVLKLGTECPPGSVTVSKTIDNEDDVAPGDFTNSAIGADLGPNQVLGSPLLGTKTTLVFCYFRAASAPGPVMAAFPDLGFPYAVFHRYDGEQPPWVLAKRWQYSDDEREQGGGGDQYDPPDLADFQEVIENPPGPKTYFDEARVR